MSLAVSSATCLPPLRCALGQGPLPSPHRQYLPSFSSISGVAKRERSVDSPEDEDALPLLMSMAQIQTKAAMESSRLPTISSILPSLHTTFGASTSQFSQMAPATPSDRASSSSPVPQSSPPSPSTLSPGLFGSSSLITTSSASSTSFGAASSRLIPSTASHQQQAYVSATNSLMELSDIISSTPALHQKLPVPLSAPEAEAPSEDSGDDNDADNEYGVDSDGHPTCSSPVSSRTRRVTRSQQRQIERIRSEIERERERARELERTLHLALRERSELLAGKRAQVGGLSFVNVLNATEDGSQPQQQQMFVDLPTGTQSLPSPSGQPPRPSSEGRSRSAPMLPPIGSIPALSPYLARKRGSLPSSAALSASSATTSPSSSPLRSAAPEPAAAHARAQLSRRRKSVDREDDEDYEPTAAAKKIKRSRSMSEGGRRLQASSSTRRRRSESQYQSRDLGGEDDHAGQVAAAFMAMRAKAIEEERRARESRLMMDVVEGADQEGDGDDDEDDECHHTQHRQSRVASGAHARRDSLLDFIKDHPHASFWLKARN